MQAVTGSDQVTQRPRTASEHLMAVWLRIVFLVSGLPVWTQVLAVYGVSRVWGWLVFSTVAAQQMVSPWGEGPLSYSRFLGLWDAGWYEQIAHEGYPTTLPRDANETVEQNTWAFMPLFPLVAGALAAGLGTPYMSVAIALALFSGFAASWAIYLLFGEALRRTGYTRRIQRQHGAQTHESAHTLALWAVALVGFAPVSAILQVPYAESFNLLFLATTLYLLLRQRYFLLLPFALATCLSRPIGVPLGATLGLWWAWCLITDVYQHRAPWMRAFTQRAPQLMSALAVCGFALLWPALAWWATGQMDAYTATETAWRGTHLTVILPWFTQSYHYLGVIGPMAFLLLLAGGVAALLTPVTSRVLPPELRLWCACFAGYLLLFWFPQSSTFRMLLPLFVLALPIVALSTSRAYRYLLLLTGATGQWVWVGWLWHWKQLPGGGDYPP
nr:hypothetical protein [Rothia sp. ZJ1223]